MQDDTLTPQQLLRKRKFGEPTTPGEEPSNRRHLVAVHLENSIGALNRVANLFSARGFNLESVAVGRTTEEGVARLTIATTGSDHLINQVIRQLEGLVDTLKVEHLTSQPHVERELCLLKVKYDGSNRAEMMDTLDIFRGKVVDVTPDHMTFEVTGPTTKVNAFVGMMKSHEVVECVRSGRVAMRRAMHYEKNK